MADIEKVHLAHMRAAFAYAELSSCTRKKVGAIIVKGTSIIDFGYNGTPSGWDNCCEEKVYESGVANEPDEKYPFVDESGRRYYLVSKPEVLHAEQNAFYKIGRSSRSADGATLYVTMQPCMQCTMDIIGHNIKEVFFAEEYRITDGIEYLRKHGIPVTHLRMDDED